MTSDKTGGSYGDSEVEDKIQEFLRNQQAPYSEPRLIEEIFKINMTDEEIPKTQDELEKVIKIRNALKKLIQEKRVFVANVEDPNTKESVLHYSAEGWHVTP